MNEQRMFYGDYKKVKNHLPMDHYDEAAKEAVFYLNNTKKYVAVNKDNETFTFYTVDANNSKFPSAEPIQYTFLTDNGSAKQNFMMTCFSDRINKGTIDEWKYLKSIEEISPEELLEELKNNKIY